MDREEIRAWLESHRELVHGAPAELLDEIEASVRRRAREEAWRAAEAYVTGRMREWEHAWGFHATETCVAREVCALLATHLRQREPTVGREDAPRLAGSRALEAFEPEAREAVEGWVRELAADVEHRLWRQIVQFTRREGPRLVREGRVSTATSWESTENWAHQAAHVARLVVEDYEARAREQGLRPT